MCDIDDKQLKPVLVVAAAAVTAFGDDPAGFNERLMAGDRAIAEISRFPVKAQAVGFAACINDLADSGKGTRLDGLMERILSRIGPIPPDAGLIAATAKAGIDALEKISLNLPADQRAVIPGYLSALAAERTGLTPGVAISAACASSTIALSRAAALISLGKLEVVLVVCADIISDFVFSGFAALKALAAGPCQPFDERRTGLSLGEGGAALLLMSAPRAKREKRTPLGIIKGWGVANDATHITAPAKDGCGLIQAIRRALDVAGLEPEQIAAVSAHGTGTIYNDAMELTAFRTVFGWREFPLYSIKGAMGHTLGAAGGIETVQALDTLRQQMAPPTAGLVNPTLAAVGLVSAKAMSFSGDYLLKTNSGFSGINAALVLQRSNS